MKESPTYLNRISEPSKRSASYAVGSLSSSLASTTLWSVLGRVILVSAVFLLSLIGCSSTPQRPDLPPELPPIEAPSEPELAEELPEEGMIPCPTSQYLPVAGKAPKIQAELIAQNLVQVRADREICRQRQQVLVDWILRTINGPTE